MRYVGILLSGVFSLSLAAQAASIQHLAFMSGCWAAEPENPYGSSEHWFLPSETKMLGVSQTLSPHRWTESYEFLRIESNPLFPNHAIVYTPIINGSHGSRFTYDAALSTPNSEVAVFANPQNDFPQVIRYTLVNGTTKALRVNLTGNSDTGTPMTVEYDLIADDCAKFLAIRP